MNHIVIFSQNIITGMNTVSKVHHYHTSQINLVLNDFVDNGDVKQHLQLFI